MTRYDLPSIVTLPTRWLVPGFLIECRPVGFTTLDQKFLYTISGACPSCRIVTAPTTTSSPAATAVRQ